MVSQQVAKSRLGRSRLKNPFLMKPLGYVGITAAILAAGGIAAFQFTRPGFPVARVIVNQDGKELEANILGKWEGYLTVERSINGQRFDLPIQTLSLSDKAYAFRLREEKAPLPPPTREKADAPYIASRLEAIKELKQREDVYQIEIQSGTLSDLLQNRRAEELQSVQKEIKNLEVAIETYKFRSRAK
jgi:hypothetical protein